MRRSTMRHLATAATLCGLAAATAVAPRAQQATPAARTPRTPSSQQRPGGSAAAPFLTAELLFPVEHWHNHSSSIIETPNGDLLVCWFHGSGERTADDVVVRGARKTRGAAAWTKPFLLADTPGYPDTNATLFLDPQQRLWLFWPTILANEWHTALMKYKRAPSADAAAPNGAPKWDTFDVMHLTPGDEFKTVTDKVTADFLASASADRREQTEKRVAKLREMAGDKLSRRLGWMTRAHPFVVPAEQGKPRRIIVPLYSDGFSFSLMALSDDAGESWKTSTPIIGAGNIQPSIARRTDGTLVTYMRDNGPAPKRLMMSTSSDRGETWSPVVDTAFPNPGSGAEVLTLRNGHWVLIYNDLERGRYSLAVSLSEDEGKSWPWTRHLERTEPPVRDGKASESRDDVAEYHYPTLAEAKDGTLHASYSYFLPRAAAACQEVIAADPALAGTSAAACQAAPGEPSAAAKSIKHAHFNEAWIKAAPADGAK